MENTEIKKIGGLSFLDMPPEQWAIRDAEVAERERKEKERKKIERYKSTVPQRYWTESLDTFRTDTEEKAKQKKTAQEFVEAVKCGAFRSLILIGKAGTGKTHLACGMLLECGGQYRTAPQIVEEIRRAKSFTARETEAEILRFYAHTPLLVIDEIGRGIAAQDEQYMIYQVINERYDTRKPTVLISNHTKKDFVNYIGTAAADRLSESVLTVEFTGASYRAQKRREIEVQ